MINTIIIQLRFMIKNFKYDQIILHFIVSIIRKQLRKIEQLKFSALKFEIYLYWRAILYHRQGILASVWNNHLQILLIKTIIIRLWFMIMNSEIRPDHFIFYCSNIKKTAQENRTEVWCIYFIVSILLVNLYHHQVILAFVCAILFLK